MRRLIFIGDIHGCAGELDALLAKVLPTSADRVISTGETAAILEDREWRFLSVQAERAWAPRG